MAVFRYTVAFQQIHITTSNTYNGLGHLTATSGLRDPPNASFYIMKGTMPTQNELDNFSAASWRSGDILIGKSVDSAGEAPFDVTNMLFKVAFEQRVATASGVAEWFMWRGGNGSNQLASATFIGSITGVGAGGDMTLNNLNVVSGNTYDIGPMSFDFSKRDYTY